MLINTKPMTYQATHPDIGLEILLETHLKAKKEAHQLFSSLNKQNFINKSSETL